MTMRRRWVGVGVMVAAIGGAAWWGVAYFRPSQPVALLTLYGNVDIRETQPAFYDTGPIASMKVSEGTHVHKGELLATIDDSRYAARLAQARAQASEMKAALTKLERGSRPEQIARAKASMQALRVTLNNDRILYARARRLVPRGAESIEVLDDARARMNAARQRYEAAKQGYLLAVKGPRTEDIDAARAGYRAAASAAALARTEYADTRLYAPQNGVIEERILEPGDMATPNTPVYTIALTQPLWVRAYVPEIDLGKVKLGMTATVTTDSYPGQIYHGWVGYLSPTAEFTPKTVETPRLRTALVYQLRVYVCNVHDQLRLGMPATVHIDLGHAEREPIRSCKGPDAAS